MKTFKVTSEAPYDRHHYKLWCVDKTVKIVDDYEDVQRAWWNFPQYCDYVEVIDKKSRGGGFV